jgi:hypothetical protein
VTESSTPEHQLPAPGFVPVSFWADPIVATPEPAGSSDGGVVSGGVHQAWTADDAPVGDSSAAPRMLKAVGDDETAPEGETAADLGDETSEASDDEVTDADDAASSDVDEDEDGDESDEDEAEDDDAEDEDAESAQRRRFAELVEERVRRARYAHHLTRPVFTPAESAMAALVERRASVWVPTMTFVATIVSAIAAVVLATRLRSDPTDPSGNQLIVVTVTVCLLAAAFATLLRAEVHYERLRPRGRVVRHDVADAYELVRDAPRRLVQKDAPLDVLRRIAALLPAAEQLVDALASYSADGGTRVRAHPAYERIIRMRAEVEALEVMLEEAEKSAIADPVHGVDAPLPQPEQVADYDGLVDLAESLTSLTEV